MKRTWMILILVLGFALGLAVGRWRSQPAPAPDATSNAATTNNAPTEVLYWYDPMYPDRHFEQPGKSPFMDMDLVPKYAERGDIDTVAVSIATGQRQNLGIRFSVATRGSLQEELEVPVRLVLDESAVSVVATRVEAVVDRLMVRTPQSPVRQGQALMHLIAPEWSAAQEEYLALLRQGDAEFKPLRAAARQRLLVLGQSAAQIRQLERDRRAQYHFTVVAPQSGIVSELPVREGEPVMAGAILARIHDPSRLWAEAAIPESRIGFIRVGLPVRLRIPSNSADEVKGVIDALLPTLDETNRTRVARMSIQDSSTRWVPGLVGSAYLHLASREPQVLIPSEALIDTGKRQVVIVQLQSGGLEAREVRSDASAMDQTEIREGLSDGERLVLSGQFLIDSEASLVGALNRLNSDSMADSESKTTESPTHEHEPAPTHEHEPAPVHKHTPAPEPEPVHEHELEPAPSHEQAHDEHSHHSSSGESP